MRARPDSLKFREHRGVPHVARQPQNATLLNPCVRHSSLVSIAALASHRTPRIGSFVWRFFFRSVLCFENGLYSVPRASV